MIGRPGPQGAASGVAHRGCDAVQQAHPGWLVFYNSATGLWSAYRRAFPRGHEIEAGVSPLVRAESAEELERKLTAQASRPLPLVSPRVVPRFPRS
ncbi:hypothetical protein [Streptosporangium sp. NPDC051022]|uniref:hypothetical protein n=1 Tax=Streptosporangium sp. NPDC051022 TaxID=3155752 RepID=UPI0034396A6D